MKTALVRVSDTEPLLSIVPMLETAGYTCLLPDRQLRDCLRDLGGNNVDEFADMRRRWGAEMPPAYLREVSVDALNHVDLYVDVNGRNGTLLAQQFPRLSGRVLCYFINGGEPRNVPDKGDCQTPEWPMVTTAQHYRSTLFCPNKHTNQEAFSCDDPPHPRGYWTNTQLSHPQDKCCPWGCGPLVRAPWLGKVYVFWPAFRRYDRVLPRTVGNYTEPVSFVHNCMSWGCQAFVAPARALGVKAYGGGNSPDGMLPHEQCFEVLSRALCTVYLKSGGAVDYSILEPMACGCPTTFHTSYAHNTRMHDLLEPGVTCLTWDSPESMAECIKQLRDPRENRRIGEAGRRRMTELHWGVACTREIDEFKAFLARNFPA